VRRFRIDAPLPKGGLARVAVIAMLGLGALVAISLPVLIALFFLSAVNNR